MNKRKSQKVDRAPLIQIRENDLQYVESQIQRSKKYAIIWDRTDGHEVSARYQSNGVYVDLVDEYRRIKYSSRTKAHLKEAIRRDLVGAMRCGKKLVINCDPDQLPNFKEEFDMTKHGLTWEEIQDWSSFRDPENYMKLVT